MKQLQISYAQFQQLDIRVGEVKKAVKIKESRNLLLLSVDLGVEYGTVTIVSGISEFADPKKMIGKKYLFVANLEPRTVFGHLSQGMLLVADNTTLLSLLPQKKKIPSGSQLR